MGSVFHGHVNAIVDSLREAKSIKMSGKEVEAKEAEVVTNDLLKVVDGLRPEEGERKKEKKKKKKRKLEEEMNIEANGVAPDEAAVLVDGIAKKKKNPESGEVEEDGAEAISKDVGAVSDASTAASQTASNENEEPSKKKKQKKKKCKDLDDKE